MSALAELYEHLADADSAMAEINEVVAESKAAWEEENAEMLSVQKQAKTQREEAYTAFTEALIAWSNKTGETGKISPDLTIKVERDIKIDRWTGESKLFDIASALRNGGIDGLVNVDVKAMIAFARQQKTLPWWAEEDERKAPAVSLKDRERAVGFLKLLDVED